MIEHLVLVTIFMHSHGDMKKGYDGVCAYY